MSWQRRDLLKLMLLSGVAYSIPSFFALRRLEVADLKEREDYLEYTLLIRRKLVKVGNRRA